VSWLKGSISDSDEDFSPVSWMLFFVTAPGGLGGWRSSLPRGAFALVAPEDASSFGGPQAGGWVAVLREFVAYVTSVVIATFASLFLLFVVGMAVMTGASLFVLGMSLVLDRLPWTTEQMSR
jgi:hypothetical protein